MQQSASQSAEAVERRPAYELLAGDLRSYGITTVFGLMSDDTIGLIATLDAMGIEFCGARHETNAVLAAEGYAAATGSLGVAVIGRGPASANAMLGITHASRTGSRVLVITGEAETMADGNAYGPDYKGFPASGVLKTVGVRAFVASDAATVRQVLAEAVRTARGGMTVTMHIPASVQNAELAATPAVELPDISAKPKAVRAEGVEAAAALLAKARRPVLMAGLGAHHSDARTAIENLGEKVGALFITSLKAKDFFRGNPYDLGIMGSFAHAPARRLLDQADCIVVFGASLNWHTTNSGTAMPRVPIIHIDDSRQHIGRWHPAEIALVGDARLVAEQLAEAMSERTDKPFYTEETRKSLADFDPASAFEPAHTPRTLDPRSLAIALERLLPRERNLIYDSGNFLMAAGYLSVPDPSHFKHSLDFSSIGCGFGTAIGFAKARPGATSVFVVGDGGLMMTLGELETAVRVNAPLVVIVFNDCAYGAELHIGRMRNLPVATTVFPDIDFAPIAATFGYEAETVRTMEDLERVAPLLKNPDGPVLLDCKVNANVIAPFLAEYAQAMSKRN
jgi:acetolactate synthase-1/2/3 large subunit